MDGIPFTTGNMALALALQTVGVKLLDVWNVYDDDLLRRLNKPSAKAAFDAGSPGKVTYFFEQTPALKPLLDAYDECAAKLKDGEELEEIEVTAEDTMRVACVVLKKRNEFANLWKGQVPKLLISNGDFTTTSDGNGGGSITSPGFKLISINASAATREKMGV